MGHPITRKAKQNRAAAAFSFTTRKLRGVTADTPEERAEKDRKINEFLKQRKDPHGRK